MKPLLGEYQIARLVPCRKCRQPTPMSTLSAQMAESFSTQLVLRGELPLDDGELLCCDSCGVERAALIRKKVNDLTEYAAAALKRIRGGWVPDDITRTSLGKYGFADALGAALRAAGRVSNRQEDDRP